MKRLPIEGYGGRYEINENGEIFSNFLGFFKKRKLTLGIRGYYQIILHKGKHSKKRPLHRLLYETFVEKIPRGKQINHIDGNKVNNSLENLEVVTPSENALHAFRIGLHQHTIGEKHGQSKLKDRDILKIRRLSNNYTQQQIAEIFNVNQATISYIINKKTWSHV
jgi:hypothetical protein